MIVKSRRILTFSLFKIFEHAKKKTTIRWSSCKCVATNYLLENWGARRAPFRCRKVRSLRFRLRRKASRTPLLLLSPRDRSRGAPGVCYGLKGVKMVQKRRPPKVVFLQVRSFPIISWRTGVRDVRPSSRTSFFPSFWGRGSGNRQPSEQRGIRG